jgi:hypothetical protein
VKKISQFSSVVEHTVDNRMVDSSILSTDTIPE